MTADALPARLRSDLAAAGFTVERLRDLFGEEAEAALHRGHRIPALRALGRLRESGGLDAAGVLAQAFVLGMPVGVDELAAALPSLGLEGAAELGLIAPAHYGELPLPGAEQRPADEVRPLMDLRPYAFTDSWGDAAWWIASDLGEVALGGPLTEDHVLGVGGASLTLSGLMIDRSARSVLDLGTGCGIQALHASRHAGRVVATDISARALRYAALNAALNGIETIEFRLGSMFEPVAGERFDHIVTNPPFVITPRVDGVPAYEYRDGGRVGDAIVAEVVAGAAEHLEPGGIAQFLGNWEYRHGEDAFDRIRGWLDTASLPLDAWVVEREVQDAPLYAETWIRDGGTRSGAEFDRLSVAWLDDFEERGVTKVGFGYVTLRLPATGESTLRRFERVDTAVGTALGAHVAETLTAHDWQASLDDAALARALLTVAPDVTEERHYWPGDEHPAVMNLRQGGGFSRSFPLDTALAAVVGACDGELSILAICGALAELLGTRESPVDERALLAEILPTIRELVTVGVLNP